MRMNSFYNIAYVENAGTAFHKFEFEGEDCSKLVIRVIETDPVAQKCIEGICSGFEKIKILSNFTPTNFQRCEEKETAKFEQRWFLEPSDTSQMGSIRQVKNQYIMEKND